MWDYYYNVLFWVTNYICIYILERPSVSGIGASMLRSPGLHITAFLQDFDKLYNRLIAYLIFEIHFNTRCYYLKMYLEDFSKSVAILLKSQLQLTSESDRNPAEALQQYRRVECWTVSTKQELVCALLHRRVCSTLPQLTVERKLRQS